MIMNTTTIVINELRTLKEKILANETFSCEEKILAKENIETAIEALIKLNKIEHIETECSNCDDDRICLTCGAWFDFEKEVYRILEG